MARPLADRLIEACVAGCTCLTKTPDHDHHDEMCTYRLHMESMFALRPTPEPQPAASKKRVCGHSTWEEIRRCPGCAEAWKAIIPSEPTTRKGAFAAFSPDVAADPKPPSSAPALNLVLEYREYLKHHGFAALNEREERELSAFDLWRTERRASAEPRTVHDIGDDERPPAWMHWDGRVISHEQKKRNPSKYAAYALALWAARTSQPPGDSYRDLYLEAAAKLDRERLGLTKAPGASDTGPQLWSDRTETDGACLGANIDQGLSTLVLLRLVSEQWVNGRNVLDGIPKGIADQVRRALTKGVTHD